MELSDFKICSGKSKEGEDSGPTTTEQPGTRRVTTPSKTGVLKRCIYIDININIYL